jgi:hypothetical protein
MGMSFHLFCRMPLKYIGSAKYCRSATSFGFEATFGDYNWRGLQGAINIPIVDGKLALRVAGEVVRRDGYQSLSRSPASLQLRRGSKSRLPQSFTTDLVWLHVSMPRSASHYPSKSIRLRPYAYEGLTNEAVIRSRVRAFKMAWLCCKDRSGLSMCKRLLSAAKAGIHLHRIGGLLGTRDTRSNAPSGAFSY